MDNLTVVILGAIAIIVAIFVALTRRTKELPARDESASLPAAKKAERPAPAAAAAASSPTDDGAREPAHDAVEPPTPEQAAPRPSKRRDVAGVRKGLASARGGFIARLAALFTDKRSIDPALLEELEEVLLTSDVGVKTTELILGRLRARLERHELSDSSAVWAALRAEALEILRVGGEPPAAATPHVVLMVGVNGVGKTTTIGKLATRWTHGGKRVLLAAGDTFRAAAVQQLEVWGKRVGAEVVRGKDGADPASVAFEAAKRAGEGGVDYLLVDTAGRLHTKAPLMDEIKKVRRSVAKAHEGAPHETLLVLDATTGQNALTQAALFKEAVDLTGIVLTKLDGTAKGGIVLGICAELSIPVRYIGLGERAEDLRDFDPEEFVEALFGEPEEARDS